jgi:hypothetical protein
MGRDAQDSVIEVRLYECGPTTKVWYGIATGRRQWTSLTSAPCVLTEPGRGAGISRRFTLHLTIFGRARGCGGKNSCTRRYRSFRSIYIYIYKPKTSSTRGIISNALTVYSPPPLFLLPITISSIRFKSNSMPSMSTCPPKRRLPLLTLPHSSPPSSLSVMY